MALGLLHQYPFRPAFGFLADNCLKGGRGTQEAFAGLCGNIESHRQYCRAALCRAAGWDELGMEFAAKYWTFCSCRYTPCHLPAPGEARIGANSPADIV